jgi:hypothetical protein
MCGCMIIGGKQTRDNDRRNGRLRLLEIPRNFNYFPFLMTITLSYLSHVTDTLHRVEASALCPCRLVLIYKAGTMADEVSKLSRVSTVTGPQIMT